MKNQFPARLTRQRLILKVILNFWTVLTMVVFVLDFLSAHGFNAAASAVGTIYLALLGIYVSDKEYSRWRSTFNSRYFGETFVILWTIIMALFVITAPFSQGAYSVPSEFALVYTGVIGVFAVSQHSKALKRKN